jgi:hypothetical protein
VSSFDVTQTLNVLQCASCRMTFAIPDLFEKDRRNDHGTFYCPAGHHNVYNGQSEAEKLRQERDRLAQRIAQRDDEIARQRDMRQTAERQAAAARGQVTKLKKRTSAGTCPCCTRTFANMAEHMKKQHPDFVAEGGANVVRLKAARA